MKRAILDALAARYEAQIAEADATVKIFLENSVGIGEHPQHIDEVDKQFEKIAAAEEKLKVLEDFSRTTRRRVMDDMTIVSKTQKLLKERLQNIGDSILAGGVDNMEKYKYLIGQAHAIQLTLQDISNLLKPKEQQDEQGNVIDIGEGSTKN